MINKKPHCRPPAGGLWSYVAKGYADGARRTAKIPACIASRSIAGRHIRKWKKFFQFFQKEELWVSLLIIITLAFSYFPILHYARSCPPGKVFGFSTGFPNDFLGNLTIVQEGFLGDWTWTQKITSTIPPSPNHMKLNYILIGHLARIFRFRPEIFFHLVRFTLTTLLLLTIYRLLIETLNKSHQRLAGLMLIVFATQIDLNFLSRIEYKLLIDYWSPLQFNQRLSYYPHYLLSFLFVLWAIIFLAKALTDKRPKTLLLASCFGFLTALVHPPVIILIFLCLPFYLITKLVSALTLKRSNPKQLFFLSCLYLSLFVLVSSLPLLYFKALSKNFTYSFLVQTEKKFSLPLSFPEIILGLGPVFFLSILAFKKVTQKGQNLLLLILPIPLVIVLGFFGVAKIFGLANIRFLQTPFFVFLGILAVLGIESLKRKPGKKFIMAISLITILVSFNSLLLPVKSISWAFHDSPFFCLKKETMTAIDWLEKNTHQDKIVLAGFKAGTLIAAYAGNRVYTTVFSNTLPSYSEQKRTLAQFYNQQLTNQEAQNFLKEERISYVFWEPEGKKMTQKRGLDYSFLKPIFENDQVIIYEQTLVKHN